MKIKQRDKPQIIKKLEVLISRLPRTFPKIQLIENDLKRYRKKFNFKRNIHHYLKRLPKKFIILNDVSLRNVKQFHIDSLIITPYALFIVQVANSKPTNNLFSHIAQIGKQKIHHYLSQARTTQTNLIQWLKERKLNMLPIHFLVVISHSTALHIKANNHITKKLTLVKHLPAKISKFYQQLQRYQTKNKKLSKRVSNEINKEKESFYFDLFEHYGINKNMILTGVRCVTCHKLSMEWINESWKCPFCQTKLKRAHQEALQDYFTLLKDSICKRECQWFLNINSKETVQEIFQAEKLVYNSKRQAWMNPE